MKNCPVCLQNKCLSEFPSRKGGKDGVRNRCKTCTTKYQKSHKSLNKEYYDKYWRDYFNKRYHSDINFKLSHFLRKTINRTIFYKTKSASSVLGCSVDELKQYLESKFISGMSWNNHGKWHIDHIIPLSKFDLSKDGDFSKACHYTNLQPLWAIDNITKSNL